MFRQLRKTLDDEYKVIISRTQILDEYTEAFQKLADAENLPLDNQVAMFLLPDGTDVGSRLLWENFEWTLL